MGHELDAAAKESKDFTDLHTQILIKYSFALQQTDKIEMALASLNHVDAKDSDTKVAVLKARLSILIGAARHDEANTCLTGQ